jgi:hypothetical protein
MSVNFIVRFLKRLIKSKLEVEVSRGGTFDSRIKAKSLETDSKPSGTKNKGSGKKKGQQDQTKVSCNLLENEKRLRAIFDKCHDFIVREINITNNSEYPARIFFFSNMIEKTVMETSVIKKLTDSPGESSVDPGCIEYTLGLLGIGEDDTHVELDKAKEAILEGNAVIFIEGIDKVIITGVKNPPGRGVEEPASEKVVRGPREGFVENLHINIVLMRRKIKSENMKMELVKLGKQTRTDVVICYMDNIANQKMVEEARRRINGIDIDSVLESNYIAEYIQDGRLNIVPTIFRTEKPDVVAGKILEGRVAIFVDGTPTVLTVPSVFSEFMMASEDYYQSPILASVLRIVRYLAFYLALTIPGVYVSLITFHSELIPSQLVYTIVTSRAGVPFNAFIECFLMTLTFTILQEADIRIPKSMGQAVSVVGALVLGEAAVAAGIVSPPMVIVAAFSGIASLAIPSPEMQLSLIHLRFIVLFSSGIFGLFGVTCVLLMLFMYLVSQRCFGVPYLTPVSPIDAEDLGDVFIRTPLWKMKKRPVFLTWKDSIRRRDRNAPDSEAETGDNTESGMAKE